MERSSVGLARMLFDTREQQERFEMTVDVFGEMLKQKRQEWKSSF